MATQIQRALTITNALLNTTASPEQIRRAGRALARRYRQLPEYDQGDDATKATIFNASILRFIIECMQDLEKSDAISESAEIARMQVTADFQASP